MRDFARGRITRGRGQKLGRFRRVIVGIGNFAQAQRGRCGIGFAIPNLPVLRFRFIQAAEGEVGIGEFQARGGFALGKKADGALEIRRGGPRVVHQLRESEKVGPAWFARCQGGRLLKTRSRLRANLVSQQHHAHLTAPLG